ncbi:unnamed protein product [Rotaria sp. Silwood1]|nr:unnamed protein product [Rotaria sp. Silwood1]
MDSRILVISMTLAFLSSPEQLKCDKKGMNTVLNQLLLLVMDAAKSDEHRHDGFHISEPLEVLVKMFVVEERTLDYVLCHAETEPTSDMSSTVHLFISLLFSFSNAWKGTDRLEQFTLVALLNILWSISFEPNYAQELVKDERFIETIQKFAENDKDQEMIEQYKPRSMESIKQATNDILHNLNRNSRDDVKPNQQETSVNALVANPAVESVNNKPSIMISYSHDNNTFCTQILGLLATCNDVFEIWIDRTHCQRANDLWEMIANGMEAACIIVCLLSTEYFESKSCRQEFIYANDSLKKKIVCVLLDNFEPKGWLGIRMTGMKYIRFRDCSQPDQVKMTELLNTILAALPSSRPLICENLPSPHHHQETPQPVSIAIQSTTPTFRPVDQWTSTDSDIHAWFASNQISIELHDLFNFRTGEEMLDYAQLLIEDRRQQMNIYAKIFTQKYHGRELPPHEFNRFAKAL